MLLVEKFLKNLSEKATYSYNKRMDSPRQMQNFIAETFSMAQQRLNSCSSRVVTLSAFFNEYTGAFVKATEFVETGFIPLNKTHWAKRGLSGKVPYWKTVTILKHSALTLFGAVEGDYSDTPYICAHLWDEDAQKALKATFGPPDGFLYQSVLVNCRSVLAYCPEEQPVVLKFSRFESPNKNSLPYEKIQTAFLGARRISKMLDKSPGFLNERSGLFLNFPEKNIFLSVLFRPLPFSQMRLDGKDLYLPVFSVYSPQIKESQLATLIFKGRPDISWFRENVAKPVIQILFLSFFRYGVHFELHQQNINLLLRDSRTEQLFVQDFFDVLEDPLAQVLLGNIDYNFFTDPKCPTVSICSEVQLSDTTGEHKFSMHVGSWYRFYLREYGLHEKCISETFLDSTLKKDGLFAPVFSDLLPSALTNFSRQYSLSFSLNKILHYQVVIDSNQDFYARLAALRDLINIALLLNYIQKNRIRSIFNVTEEVSLFYNKLITNGFLTSLGEIFPDSVNTVFTGWESWLIYLSPEITVLFQRNLLTPEKMRYFAVLS